MNKKSILKQGGAEAFSKQLRNEGGTYTIDEVSRLLGISISEVEERTGSEFLAVQLDEGISYPCWQFDGNEVVKYFSDVMAMLDLSYSPVGIVQFFLTKDEDLNKSLIDALKDGNKKELALVKLLAQQFHQQVAR